MGWLARLGLALAVLRGRPTASCARLHLAPDEAAVGRTRLQELERAADELKIARGAIAALGKLDEYARAVRETLGEK